MNVVTALTNVCPFAHKNQAMLQIHRSVELEWCRTCCHITSRPEIREKSCPQETRPVEILGKRTDQTSQSNIKLAASTSGASAGNYKNNESWAQTGMGVADSRPLLSYLSEWFALQHISHPAIDPALFFRCSSKAKASILSLRFCF